MARRDDGPSVRRLTRRVKQAAASLKAEYDAGKRGDESPTEPIYPTPAQQWAALTGLLAGSRRAATASPAPDPSPTTDPGHDDIEADEVARALRGVDWQHVKAATAQRTGAAADAMRSMAREVDWAKVQPVAAQVSSALIAAVASGRVPVAGRMGPIVAKALTDHGVLAQRVGTSLARDRQDLPPDFRDELGDVIRQAEAVRQGEVVETTATDVTDGADRSGE